MISLHEASNVLRSYVADAERPAADRAAAGAPVQGPAPAGQEPSGVTSSGQTSEVAAWLAQLRALPDVRSDKVAGVGQQIQSGQYPPTSTAVAASILNRWIVNP